MITNLMHYLSSVYFVNQNLHVSSKFLAHRQEARSQYSEGPATGHLDTGFSWFPCVYNQTLRRFPTFQVATTCFLCSPPDLNFLDPYFIFMYMHNSHCHRVKAQLQ